MTNASYTPVSARGSARVGALFLVALCAGSAAGEPLQEEAAPAEARLRAVGANAAPCLSVRVRPSYRAPVIDCLEVGSLVTVIGDQGGWSRLGSNGEPGGWVSARLLAAAEVETPGAAESATAVAPAEPGRVEEAPVPAETALPEPEVAVAVAWPRARDLPPLPKLRPEMAAPVEAPAAAEPSPLPEEETALTIGVPEAAEPPPLPEPEAAAESRGEPEAPAREPEPPPASAAESDRTERAEAATRIETLEAEMAAARDAREAAEAEAGSLEARVEELTEERDELARELASAEARLLYVVSDLEETRAELMRLKGVPAQLVEPEPELEPAPVVPPPAPEPEPAPDPDPEASEPAATVDFMALDEVVGTVRAWAQAWADQRVDDYLAFYSDSFAPEGGESREAWAAQRRERVSAPGSIEITLGTINPIIQGDRARVMFVQGYASDTFSDTVDKTLVLERAADGTWQIVEERAE